MDKNVMSSTRGTLNLIALNRRDLKSIKSNSKSQSQTFRNAITTRDRQFNSTNTTL